MAKMTLEELRKLRSSQKSEMDRRDVDGERNTYYCWNGNLRYRRRSQRGLLTVSLIQSKRII